MEFLYFLLIGLAAGWLAGQVMKEGGFGVVGDLVVGIVGAILGGFLMRLLGFATVTLLAKLIVAFGGACLLLFILRKVKV